MPFFEPDDFSDDPYQGGLNQMGHVALGAAVYSVMPFTAGLFVSVAIASALALAWELSQRRWRGATKADYFADLFYWWSGVALWATAIHGGYVTGWAIYAPWALVGAWCLEYARISYVRMFK